MIFSNLLEIIKANWQFLKFSVQITSSIGYYEYSLFSVVCKVLFLCIYTYRMNCESFAAIMISTGGQRQNLIA